MDIWNRRLLLIKTLLSLIYASLYEGTHQSHAYFQSLVMQTQPDLEVYFSHCEREITLLSRIYLSRFKKCRYNVLRRRDISREKSSIGMIYLTSQGYKRRGIMNASLTLFIVNIHSLGLILMIVRLVNAASYPILNRRLPVQIIILIWI